MEKKKVAFVCVHNSCRSQMAEAIANIYYSDILEIYSAGTEKVNQINEKAIFVIKELYDYDMSETQYSKLVSEIPDVHYVITMGCNVSCPTLSHTYMEDWGLEDPSGKNIKDVMNTAKMIENKLESFINKIIK